MPAAAAITGSAILGAGVSMAGASKQSKAAKQAAQAQTQAAQQQQNLSREIYYDQRGLFQPYYQAGLQGLYGQGGVMDLMGMGPYGRQVQPSAPNVQTGQQTIPGLANIGIGGAQAGMAGGNAFLPYSPGGAVTQQPQPDWGAYLAANPDVAAYYRANPRALAQFGGDMNRAAAAHYQLHGQREGRQLPMTQLAQPAQTGGVPGMVSVGGGAYMPGGQTQPMVEAGPATDVRDLSVSQPGTEAGPVEEQVDPRTANLRATPGYQFLQDESRRALENSFAARGKLLSGSAMKALQERGMGLADQTYQQALQNAFNLTNIGTGAGAQISGAAGQYGQQMGNAFGQIGQAQANRAYNQADAWNAGAQGVAGAISGGLGMYGGYSGWGSPGWTGGSSKTKAANLTAKLTG